MEAEPNLLGGGLPGLRSIALAIPLMLLLLATACTAPLPQHSTATVARCGIRSSRLTIATVAAFPSIAFACLTLTLPIVWVMEQPLLA